MVVVGGRRGPVAGLEDLVDVRLAHRLGLELPAASASRDSLENVHVFLLISLVQFNRIYPVWMRKLGSWEVLKLGTSIQTARLRFSELLNFVAS